ncbi:uncharacterized protein MONOS_1405 [Monocercomonoides exilis]|uniref:uncharacterized protein n=1 Tax=Monocercomonoides exilis TaxID=2049356 RepID=UPI00355A4722|nr:hypothetical protein MONOS_1405 [Monocercomonoides exilis]
MEGSNENSDFDQMKQKISSLTEELKQKQNELETMRSTQKELLEARQSAIDQVQKEKDKAKSAQDDLKKLQLATADSQKLISILRSEVEKSKKMQEDYEQTENEFKKMKLDFQSQVRKIEEERDSASIQVKQLEAMVDTLQQKEKENEELMREKSFESEERLRKIDQGDRKTAQLTAQCEGMQEQIEKMKSDHKIEIEMLHDQITSLVETIRTLEKEKDEAKEKHFQLLSSTRSDQEAYAEQAVESEKARLLQQLADEKREAEAQINQHINDFREMSHKYDDAKNKIRDLEVALLQKEKEAAAAEQRASEIEKQAALANRGTATETRVLLDRIKAIEVQFNAQTNSNKEKIKAQEEAINNLNQKIAAEEKEKIIQTEKAMNAQKEVERLTEALAKAEFEKKRAEEAAKQAANEKEELRMETQHDLMEKTGTISREVDEWRRSAADAEYKAKELATTQNMLENTLQQTKREAEVERRVLQSELNKLRQRLDQVTKDNEMLAQQLDDALAVKENLSSQVEALTSGAETLEEREAKVESELADVMKLKKDLETIYNQLHGEKAMTDAAQVEMKKQHRQMEEELMAIRDEMNRAEQQHNEEIAERDGRIAALQQKVNEQSGELGILEAQKKDNDEELAKMTSDLRRLRTENAKLSENKRVIESEDESLQQQLSNATSSKALLESALQAAKAEMEDMRMKTQQELDDANSEIRHLRSKYNDLQTVSDSRAKRLAELEQLFDQSNNRTKQLLQETTKMRVVVEDQMLTTAADAFSPSSSQHRMFKTPVRGSPSPASASTSASSSSGMVITPGMPRRTASASRVPLRPSGLSPSLSVPGSSSVYRGGQLTSTLSNITRIAPPTNYSSTYRRAPVIPAAGDGGVGSLHLKTASTAQSTTPGDSTASAALGSSTAGMTPGITYGQSDVQRRLNELLRKKAPTSPVSAVAMAADTATHLTIRTRTAAERVAMSEDTRATFPGSQAFTPIRPAGYPDPNSDVLSSSDSTVHSEAENREDSTESLPTNVDGNDEDPNVRALVAGVILKDDPRTSAGDLQADLARLRGTMQQMMATGS